MSRPVYITVGSEYPESSIVRSALSFPIIKDHKKFSLQCITDLKKEGIVFGTYEYLTIDIVVFVFQYNPTYYTLCWIMKNNKGEDIAHSYYVKVKELNGFIGKRATDLYRIVKSNKAENAKVGRYLDGKIVYFIGDISDPKAHKIADICIGRYNKLDNSNKGYRPSDTHNSFRHNINRGIIGNEPYVPPEFHAPIGDQQASRANAQQGLPYDEEPLNLMNDFMEDRIQLVGTSGGRAKRTKRTKRTKRAKRTKRLTRRYTKRR
jgi:hypothetical protein